MLKGNRIMLTLGLMYNNEIVLIHKGEKIGIIRSDVTRNKNRKPIYLTFEAGMELNISRRPKTTIALKGTDNADRS